MEISSLGHASIKLKGKNATVVCDPFDPKMVGIKFPKTVADIVTISHQHGDHNFASHVEGVDGAVPLIFQGPGEYEAKGVDIMGIGVFHDDKNGAERGKNTIFKFEIEGVLIVHLGDLGHMLSESELEQIDTVDVLLIPTGGFYTIDAAMASKVATALEPKIIIPIHYNRPELDQKVYEKLQGVEVFLKEMGKEGVVPVPKLKVTKDSLPQETQVVVLE